MSEDADEKEGWKDRLKRMDPLQGMREQRPPTSVLRPALESHRAGGQTIWFTFTSDVSDDMTAAVVMDDGTARRVHLHGTVRWRLYKWVGKGGAVVGTRCGVTFTFDKRLGRRWPQVEFIAQGARKKE